MAESTLTLKKSDFEQAVGYFLGYGRGADAGETAWTTAQYNNIDACIRSGLRRFYFPMIAGQMGVSHAWSFLKPVANIPLSSGVRDVNLPDDFNGFIGDLIVSSSTSGQYPDGVKLTGLGQIQSKYASSFSTSGRPLSAAVYPKKETTSQTGQRWLLTVWPEPDADYTLIGRYSILPNHLTGATPYCYGGAEHMETIREACLAAAEKDMDDASGIHEAAFQRELAASISKDRMTSPSFHGYNGDSSDWMDYRYGRPLYPWYGNTVTNPPAPI